MASITVDKLYISRRRDLELTLLGGSDKAREKTIQTAELHRPGLALTGFLERFTNRRVQVLGERWIVLKVHHRDVFRPLLYSHC